MIFRLFQQLNLVDISRPPVTMLAVTTVARSKSYSYSQANNPFVKYSFYFSSSYSTTSRRHSHNQLSRVADPWCATRKCPLSTSASTTTSVFSANTVAAASVKSKFQAFEWTVESLSFFGLLQCALQPSRVTFQSFKSAPSSLLSTQKLSTNCHCVVNLSDCLLSSLTTDRLGESKASDLTFNPHINPKRSQLQSQMYFLLLSSPSPSHLQFKLIQPGAKSSSH